jgi:hypothetical protein
VGYPQVSKMMDRLTLDAPAWCRPSYQNLNFVELKAWLCKRSCIRMRQTCAPPLPGVSGFLVTLIDVTGCDGFPGAMRQTSSPPRPAINPDLNLWIGFAGVSRQSVRQSSVWVRPFIAADTARLAIRPVHDGPAGTRPRCPGAAPLGCCDWPAR